MDAALAIAVTQGISAVTIASVADYLDVTRPVIYTCFSNRVALIAELVEREEERLREELTSVLSRRAPDADAALFVDLFRALLRTVHERPDTWRLVYASPDSDVAEYFGRGRARMLIRCMDMLRPMLAAWGVPAAEADRKARLFAEMWVSAGEGAVRIMLDGDDWTPAELSDFLGQSLFGAVRSGL